MASSKDFAPLFTPIQGELIGFIVARGIPPSDADDVLQEAVTAMLERIDTFEIGSNFRAWAFAFVRNQSLAWRKRNRKRGLPISDELAETLGSTVMEETRKEGADREALRSCLEGLQPKAKKIITSRYNDGLSVPSIAEQLRRTASSVHVSLTRIRKTLADCVRKRSASSGEA